MQAVSIGGGNLGNVLQVGESPSPEVVAEAAPPIFKEWPKIVRLSKSVCIVTEKIDGTNAAFHVVDGKVVAVQSRNRFIQPGRDNYGFAAWVHENAETLVADLGDGVHFGEWWGAGIGPRGYTQSERFFSLFNAARFTAQAPYFTTPRLRVVPILAQGPTAEQPWVSAMTFLREVGSVAMPGHRNPEGLVVCVRDANHLWKILCENDNLHKGQCSECGFNGNKHKMSCSAGSNE